MLPLPKMQTIIKDRLIETAGLLAESDEKQPVTFQHSILCQTCLPYRDPGDDVRTWERLNGTAHLEVMAGKAMHPEQGRLVPLGLPFGPKPRLVLAHLNAEALRTDSPEIEIEDSLTAFVKRLKLARHGRNMRTIKDQLARLSASSVRLGMVRDGRAITVNSQIVTAFDLWFPKDDRQRVLWPSTVRLSLDYFESLKAHAVPLDERALVGPVSLGHGARSLRMAGATAAPDTRSRTGNSSRGLRCRSNSGRDYHTAAEIPRGVHAGAAASLRRLSRRENRREPERPVPLHLAAPVVIFVPKVPI